MEVCKIVERQRYCKKLNNKQVTNILRAICQCPQQREQSIHEMVLHNKYTEDRFAQEFGIKEMINGGTEEPRFCDGLIQMCSVENALRDVHRRTTELPVRYVQGGLEKIDKTERILSGTVLDHQIGSSDFQHTHKT